MGALRYETMEEATTMLYIDMDSIPAKKFVRCIWKASLGPPFAGAHKESYAISECSCGSQYTVTHPRNVRPCMISPPSSQSPQCCHGSGMKPSLSPQQHMNGGGQNTSKQESAEFPRLPICTMYRIITGHTFIGSYTQRFDPKHAPDQIACSCGVWRASLLV
ncbi:hypothetical protein BJV74DRAFT_285636 [Russula compacta]|nr:hypothetical protein BJV74DRAFT_285636 [Russula compacta]